MIINSPEFRSGHLDIKDAQCAEKKLSHYIAFLSYARPKGPKRCASFSNFWKKKGEPDSEMLTCTSRELPGPELRISTRTK